MTLREALLYGKQALFKAQIADAETDAWLLLENVCGCTRNDYYMRGDRQLSAQEEEKYRSFLEQRAQHIPLQHLLGEQQFMGLRFFVTPDVLIPRQDTEVLVMETLKVLSADGRLLDLCTGSGCILLSTLHYAKNCTGVGADLSEKALAVAAGNAKALGIKCTLMQGDLFENIEGKFDVIVSNPPYIASGEIETLMPEVKDHDPLLALDGGADGLFFYRRIVREAPHYLKPDGWLLFEIGCTQGAEVSALMREAGFGRVEIVKDLAGLERIVKGQLEEDSNV